MSVMAALKLARLAGCRVRAYSSKSPESRLKVAVLGAAGQTGQPLSLLLKTSPLLDELALYDLKSTRSLSDELSHIDTKCRVKCYKNRLNRALEKAQIVVIVACAKHLSDSDFRTQFQPNATIVFELMASIARHSPKALVAIATEPINSLVPVASEVMTRLKVYDPSRIFGVTTLDVMRTNLLAARTVGLAPEQVDVPVIGGHSDKTIVPVLSHINPLACFTAQELVDITDKVQTASENLVKLKKGNTLSLSSAFATARFVVSLARAIRGENNVHECAYVRSDLYSNVRYLATPLVLGTNGIQKNIGLPPLSDYEETQLQSAAALLREDIQAGECFVIKKGTKTSSCSQPS